METADVIEKQCVLLKDQKYNLDSSQLKAYLDHMLMHLNHDNKISDINAIEEIVSSMLTRTQFDHIFHQAKLLDHPLILFIRDVYLEMMHSWRTNQVLDTISGRFFIQTAMFFSELTSHMTDSDVDQLKKILVHQLLIHEIRACLVEIAATGKYLEDRLLESIDYILRAIHYLQKGRLDIQNLPIISELIDRVVDCVCSIYFISIFQQLAVLERLNQVETFLLDTCTDYISWHIGNHYNNSVIAVRNALLHSFNCWFQNQIPSYQKLSSVAIKIMGQLCITLIGGNATDEELFPERIRDGYCTMIDQLSTILKSIASCGKLHENTIDLTRVLTQNLYSLTMTNDLRIYIKSKNMITDLLKLADYNDETVQFHVYRILASIMTENDLKSLKNSAQIVNVFLKFLTDLVDDSSRLPRFHNLLRSLKILVQHDEIKEELVKQKALPLLLRCATESKFDVIKARVCALEILLSLAFNDDAARPLKNNRQFMSNLRTWHTSSSESQLQRISGNLLWELESDDRATNRSVETLTISDITTKKYDIMLSYSHSDKDLCYRIHDSLVKDSFQVWLDRHEMHGETMVAMATAIENSDFVCLCMSEAYKQSVYCQSEAHYAFERRRHLIPLVMKPGYRPDGWLGIITSGKIYVDFPKLGFDVAYNRLRREISQYPSHKIQSITLSTPILHSFDVDQIRPSHDSDGDHLFVEEFPHSVEQWTTAHVRSFLKSENLDCLLSVLGKMNGHLLHETYRRCKENWAMMFQTFKIEVAEATKQKTLLTIEIYIRFLDTIEKYIPITVTKDSKSSSPASMLCTII